MDRMMITNRWMAVLFSAGMLLGAAVCRADEFDFPQDSFFADHPGDAGPHAKKWHLRMGGGLALLASPYKGHIPPISGNFQVNQAGGSFFLGTGIFSSIPLDVTPDKEALEFEGSLLRDVTPNFSIGLMGGLSSGHTADVDEATAFPGVHFYYFGEEFTVSFRYELRTAQVMPMVEYGKRYTMNKLEVRPYVMAAVGACKVDENVYVVLSGTTIQASGQTRYYAAGAGGGGVGVTFSKSYTADIEARYQRIFSPGQPLALFVPHIQFGYLF